MVYIRLDSIEKLPCASQAQRAKPSATAPSSSSPLLGARPRGRRARMARGPSRATLSSVSRSWRALAAAGLLAAQIARHADLRWRCERHEAALGCLVVAPRWPALAGSTAQLVGAPSGRSFIGATAPLARGFESRRVARGSGRSSRRQPPFSLSFPTLSSSLCRLGISSRGDR